MKTYRSVLLILFAGFLVSTCSSSPTNPTTDQPTGPQPELTLSCPAEVTTESLDGDPVSASFNPKVEPPISGVRVNCSPESGSEFPIGTTSVHCAAADVKQTATCQFTVRVKEPPKLTKTRIVAFGDSITDGFLGIGPDLAIPGAAFAYPFRLQLLIDERYQTQSITVSNRGLGGETAIEGNRRLPGVLGAENPDLLLLLEGINNIRDDGHSAIVSALRSDIELAQSRGISVIIATLTPVGGTREDNHPGTRAEINAVNDGIFQIAKATGIDPPVDLYTAFLADRDFLGEDGLHPSEAGYQLMADLFFKEIRARFETQQGLKP
jgi:lysophospholipase L1-like esterase